MASPKTRRTIFYLFVLTGIFFSVKLYFFDAPATSRPLIEQTKVFNEMKVVAQPVIKKDVLIVNLELETFERPEILSSDINELCFITVDDQVFNPSHIEIYSKDMYKISVGVIFEKLTTHINSKQIDFHIVTDTETVFSWNE